MAVSPLRTSITFHVLQINFLFWIRTICESFIYEWVSKILIQGLLNIHNMHIVIL